MGHFIPSFFCLCLINLVLGSGGNEQTPVFNKDPKKNWVVLVAGSNTWWNYRHQADVCHAYQLLKERGIPESNIITMMYDDIAHNRNNPFPGKIFNDYGQKDVYNGVKVDYREEEVTPEMFTKVMAGDPGLLRKGKKVLQSGPEDHVFVFFTDHGGEGLICFPSGDLYAKQLQAIVTGMHEKKRYKHMVLYIEACYSGSMFHNILPGNINVYVTTAANHMENSYAAFCGHKVIDTCLADLYSYNWMSDSEAHIPEKWTLDQQFESVRSKTKRSHVMKYGDMKMGRMPFSDFQTHKHTKTPIASDETSKPVEDFAPSHRSRLMSMTKRVMSARTDGEYEVDKKRLHRAIQLGHIVNETVADIVAQVKSSGKPSTAMVSAEEQMDCFESVFPVFTTNCFSIQQVPEVAENVPSFQKLCSEGYPIDVLKQSILTACA